MPDIRRSTTVIDDFQRPDENPIIYSVAHPWMAPFAAGGNIQIDAGVLKGVSIGNSPSFAAYDTLFMSGDDAETWGIPHPPSYSFPEGTRQGLMNASEQGYAVLHTGGFGIILRRYTGGGGFTDITANMTAGSGARTTFGCYQLFKFVGGDFEVWRSLVSGNPTTWELVARVPDSTYRTNMMMVYGSTGNEDGWGEVGAGVEEEFIVDIYRRPFE